MTLERPLRTAALLFVVLFLVSGVIYPALNTGIGELAFPSQAHGSLVSDRTLVWLKSVNQILEKNLDSVARDR